MTNYLILIPNSESKQKGGEDLTYRFVSNLKKYNSFIKIQPYRDSIVREIRRFIRESTHEELEQFFELKGDNLRDAVDTMLSVNDEECMSVIKRMSGVMYNSIGFSSLQKFKQDRFNSSVIIIDALFGVLAPQDMIPHYKCKMSMRLFDSTLSKFWKNELRGYFEYVCRDKLVIDLLPNSHKEVIVDSNIDRVSITFAKSYQNSYKVEGHVSKALKGELIHYILGFEQITRNDLKQFKHSKGHVFSEQFSTESEFVYLI